jgi:hypothetical protein
MTANKVLNFEPVYVPTAAANLFNVGTATGAVGFAGTNPYAILYHIQLSNKDTQPHIVSLYKGGSGAAVGGTEFGGFANISIQPQSSAHWYGKARFDSADFLTGTADLASKVVINIEGEIGLS